MRSRVITLATVTLWTLCVDVCLLADLQSSASSRPNIVWIMAEDISTELGCYGHHAVKTPMLSVIRELHAQGKLNEAQQLLLTDMKPEEELYDIQADPHELNNFAPSAEHRTTLKEPRTLLDRWIADTNDKGLERPKPFGQPVQ